MGKMDINITIQTKDTAKIISPFKPPALGLYWAHVMVKDNKNKAILYTTQAPFNVHLWAKWQL